MKDTTEKNKSTGPAAKTAAKITCSRLATVILTVLWLALAVWLHLKPATEISAAERRKLQQSPSLSKETLLNGEFTKDFELWLQDQFPGRQNFRQLKSIFARVPMGLREVNGYIHLDGHLAKLPPADEKARLEYGIQRLDELSKKLRENSQANFFSAIIPDKNYYLAQKHNLPCADYDAIWSEAQNTWRQSKFIDLRDSLSLGDYYRTDLHWRQENLAPVLAKLRAGLNLEDHKQEDNAQIQSLKKPFYGTYYGQAALPVAPDNIRYITNIHTESATVEHLEKGKGNAVYDFVKADGRDPYNLFLSGESALITVKNPQAKTNRELIMFRDSFGSSLAPLLLPYYSRITLVDLRYMSSKLLPKYVDLSGADKDVLLIYSLPILAEANTLK